VAGFSSCRGPVTKRHAVVVGAHLQLKFTPGTVSENNQKLVGSIPAILSFAVQQ
jgi:hypothetical protein